MVNLFGRRKRGEQIELTVRGMTCEHCEMRVQKALMSVPGVVDAKADREHERAVVTLEPGQQVSTEALIAAVEAMDYDAEPLTR